MTEKDKQDIALLRYSIILIISRQGLSFPEWRNIHRHLSAVLPWRTQLFRQGTSSCDKQYRVFST